MRNEAQIEKLNEIYSKLPNTLNCTGCAKCCMVQHPHCFYIEFLNIMSEIENWSESDRKKLHVDCLRNYLANTLNKRCVFLGDDKRCRVYDVRDYNCRLFGAIPKKEYSKRVKEAKRRFPGVVLDLQSQSDCCVGIKPENYISKSDIDKFFDEVLDLDREIGISNEDISESNNYMTFHDHYILYHFGDKPEILRQLTDLKVNGSDQEKRDFLKTIEEKINV